MHGLPTSSILVPLLFGLTTATNQVRVKNTALDTRLQESIEVTNLIRINQQIPQITFDHISFVHYTFMHSRFVFMMLLLPWLKIGSR